MKLGALLLQLQTVEQKIAVYDELVAYLQRDGLEIPVESGVVPEDVVELVVAELNERRQSFVDCLGAAEDVEVEDVDLEDLGSG